MIFAYQNNISDYTLTADNYSDVYTVENVKDRKLEKIWKGTTVDATQDIVIDAGAAITPDIIAILGHNFIDGVETISIQANVADAWGAPPIDYTFTSIVDLMFYRYAGPAYQYWRILIENCDIPDKPPEIGLLYFGDELEFTDVSSATPANYDDNSIFEKSANRTLSGYLGTKQWHDYTLKWVGLFPAMQTALKNMFNTIGKAYPFILIWHPTEIYIFYPNLYCNFITGIGFDDSESNGFVNADITVSIGECK